MATRKKNDDTKNDGTNPLASPDDTVFTLREGDAIDCNMQELAKVQGGSVEVILQSDAKTIMLTWRPLTKGAKLVIVPN